MSIDFTNKKQISENNLIDFPNDIDISLKVDTIYHHFVKMFDTHFLNYISFRKQRDLMITNIFYQIILNDITIDKKIKEKYNLSDNFEIQHNKLKINYEEILPISTREIVLNIEQEILILKTFQLFFEEFSEKYKEINTQMIEKKIKKIQFLTDENMFNKLTHNQYMRDKILDIIGKIKDYDSISINMTFLNSLKKEAELMDINI